MLPPRSLRIIRLVEQSALPVRRRWTKSASRAPPSIARTIGPVGRKPWTTDVLSRRASLLALCDERRTANRTLKSHRSGVVCHHIDQVLRPNTIKGIRDRKLLNSLKIQVRKGPSR
jgi:hypothetical protein